MQIKQSINFLPTIEVSFWSIYQQTMKDIDCYYINYHIENLSTKHRIIFQTNKEWQYYYLEKKFVNDCHILQLVRSCLQNGQKNIILPWDVIKPKNRKQREIDGTRLELGIGSGVSFSQEFMNLREHVSLCTKIKDMDYSGYLIEKLDVVKKHIEAFRNLAVTSLILQNEIQIKK